MGRLWQTIVELFRCPRMRAGLDALVEGRTVMHLRAQRSLAGWICRQDPRPRKIGVTLILRVNPRWVVATSRNNDKRNITVSLSRQVLRKAKVLAARRETSISGLLAHEIESLVGEDEAYDRAERQATALLDRGFHLGGLIRASRDELHER